jgi:hypothetical protein
LLAFDFVFDLFFDIDNTGTFFFSKVITGKLSKTLNYEKAAMVQEAPLKIYARGVVSYFYFFRAPRARAENQGNQ